MGVKGKVVEDIEAKEVEGVEKVGAVVYTR